MYLSKNKKNITGWDVSASIKLKKEVTSIISCIGKIIVSGIPLIIYLEKGFQKDVAVNTLHKINPASTLSSRQNKSYIQVPGNQAVEGKHASKSLPLSGHNLQ